MENGQLLSPEQQQLVEKQILESLALKESQDQKDIRLCETELQEVLKKYDCTLVADTVHRNGQLMRIVIAAIKNTKE